MRQVATFPAGLAYLVPEPGEPVRAELVPVTCTVGRLTALQQRPDGSWQIAYEVPLG